MDDNSSEYLSEINLTLSTSEYREDRLRVFYEFVLVVTDSNSLTVVLIPNTNLDDTK
jgi:hypothetical protein